MLVSTKMITGFNTDVSHDGHVYHVQTEDRGEQNPVFESLVYMGGTVVAKKATPYSDRLTAGASEEAIASLLRRQHQVVIAAIRAGRIDDLIRHTQKEDGEKQSPDVPRPTIRKVAQSEDRGPTPSSKQPAVSGSSASKNPAPEPNSQSAKTSMPNTEDSRPSTQKRPSRGDTGGLNLDQVIADYLKRSNDDTSLEIKVLSPDAFNAGSNIALRVQVSRRSKPEFDAIVTVKIIGTAFKPQVFIGRVGRDGVAIFTLALPGFTAGTAAMVIEARSSAGRGELKKLIRRA